MARLIRCDYCLENFEGSRATLIMKSDCSLIFLNQFNVVQSRDVCGACAERIDKFLDGLRIEILKRRSQKRDKRAR